MRLRIKYVIASMLLLLAASCAGGPDSRDGAATAPAEKAPPASGTASAGSAAPRADTGTKVAQKIKLKKEYDTVVAEAEYPKTGVEPIDAQIKEFIYSSINSFVENEGSEVFREDFKNGIFISYEPYGGYGDIMSFRFIVSVYTGGAHPINAVECRNYQRETYEAINLDDILKTDSGCLEKVSEFAIEQLIRNSPQPEPDVEWIRDGAGPDPMNYRNFTFDGANVVFHFGNYQVAPYAEGIKEVSIPFSELEGCMTAAPAE